MELLKDRIYDHFSNLKNILNNTKTIIEPIQLNIELPNDSDILIVCRYSNNNLSYFDTNYNKIKKVGKNVECIDHRSQYNDLDIFQDSEFDTIEVWNTENEKWKKIKENSKSIIWCIQCKIQFSFNEADIYSKDIKYILMKSFNVLKENGKVVFESYTGDDHLIKFLKINQYNHTLIHSFFNNKKNYSPEERSKFLKNDTKINYTYEFIPIDNFPYIITNSELIPKINGFHVFTKEIE